MRRGCESVEEAVEPGEVTTAEYFVPRTAAVNGTGGLARVCGTPGCSLHDFHAGPCSSWVGLFEARPRRRARRPGDELFMRH